jgi:DNA replication protein DnaC
VKSLDSFDFKAIPSLNKMLVLELARGDYTLHQDNVIALGNSGAGKTHIALALGLAACQKGHTVGLATAVCLVHQPMEAKDARRLQKLQRQIQSLKLLIVDGLGYVQPSPTGIEPLFETFSQRYVRGSLIVTSNLPFDEQTFVIGNERLTGARLDRHAYHIQFLEMVGESYRLKSSKTRLWQTKKANMANAAALAQISPPLTG